MYPSVVESPLVSKARFYSLTPVFSLLQHACFIQGFIFFPTFSDLLLVHLYKKRKKMCFKKYCIYICIEFLNTSYLYFYLHGDSQRFFCFCFDVCFFFFFKEKYLTTFRCNFCE